MRSKAQQKTIAMARRSISNARARVSEVNVRINRLQGAPTAENLITLLILQAEVRSLEENIVRAQEMMEQAEMQL